MIRVGIIGWGENGKKIAQALQNEIKDTEVIAVATEDAEGRIYAAEKMGLKHVFNNPTSILELHQVDVIVVCSEGDMHLMHVEKALSSGSNVFIDHPLASNVEDCKKLEKIIDSYPSYKTTVAFPRRFDKKLARLQKEIEVGKLGKIIRVEAKTFEPIPPRKEGQVAPHVRKGIFMDLMLQDIDMVRWLCKAEYESVYVAGNAHKYPSLARQNDADSAVCIARLSGDILLNLTSSRVVHRGAGYELIIVGTLGEATIDTTYDPTRLIHNQEGKPYYLADMPVDNDYLDLLKDYIEAVRYGNKIKYQMSDATEATRVAVAMTKSFLLGEEVSLKS